MINHLVLGAWIGMLQEVIPLGDQNDPLVAGRKVATIRKYREEQEKQGKSTGHLSDEECWQEATRPLRRYLREDDAGGCRVAA